MANQFEGPLPGRKLQSACLAASEQMATNANQRDNAAIGCSSVEEADLEPSPVTGGSAALTDATHGEIQSGWTRAKLEPDF
jgi:hypothetical protein